MDESKERVVQQYHAAVKAYSDAVSRLLGLNSAEFRAAYDQAEALRLIAEKHRVALQRFETPKR